MAASILEQILTYKREVEVPERMRALPLAELRRAAEAMPPACDFTAALRQTGGNVALIAEVKRASPSKGMFVQGAFDPAGIARLYVDNGAAAISVLTDQPFFKGALEHLRLVRSVVAQPVLRKDFVVDPYQVYEARAWGADAVLLIVAALDDAALRDLHRLAESLSLTPLVEVHNETEVERALNVGARLIGVNNRDLHTFRTDLTTTARCACRIRAASAEAVIVSESGIFTAEDVACVAAMGAQAVLVGEALITAPDMAAQVRALARVKRPAHL
ncbi:MAG: indole-3-glycerol phosphate synthase TrpC [Anaerolineae bacterium]|nr:indole-3-glycerol phosphate synthase TrpC [Thermoflexales bacterium]MDW8395237.1 indole-3-glycerol phosphate synthase TrpC [Anaerolineae bacterium]